MESTKRPLKKSQIHESNKNSQSRINKKHRLINFEVKIKIQMTRKS